MRLFRTGGVGSAACTAALLMALSQSGCGVSVGGILPDESTGGVDTDQLELLVRFAHISDAHMVDEESPARLTVGARYTASAWRPHEAYATQVLDGFVRTINKIHLTGDPIDFTIHTGDGCDNSQRNELEWLITVMDGGTVDPLSGIDDRDPNDIPDSLLDPHHAFEAQGLYRNGLHGDAPTIPWYNVPGNHDRFAVGVFPIVVDLLGRRFAPLPLEDRYPLFYPLVLDPLSDVAWGAITPANPGPPPDVNLPVPIEANPERQYISARQFVQAHIDSPTDPPGHGFDPQHPERTWYSVSPAPGVRLIGLNSSTPLIEQPALVYFEGSISLEQVSFLREELVRAQAAGEVVIVATHHPSDALAPSYGSALSPQSFVTLLNEFPCVVLHLAGHWHRHATFDRGGYVEMVTASTLDAPQEGRIVEIWRALDSEPRASARAMIGSPFSSPLYKGLGGPPRFEVGDTMIVNKSTSNRAASFSPHLQRRWGTHVSSPLYRGGPRGVSKSVTIQQAVQPQITLRYRTFSHLDEIATPDQAHADLFNDPMVPMRRQAAELAGVR